MAKKSPRTRKDTGIAATKATRADMAEMVERLQKELHDEKERYHESCCTWQHAAENHTSDPTLMKNMINALVPEFNKYAIGVVIENNYVTFIKESIEVKLHCSDLLRVGTESVFGMFEALPFE